MLHVLSYRSDIVAVILCGCELGSYIKRRTDRGFVRAGGEGNIWCEREVGIEGCRRLFSELHVCYCSPCIINKIIAGR
jgi:hypothetical protein